MDELPPTPDAQPLPGFEDLHSSRARLASVQLQSYKSIARCDVTLGPITFLVGRNGAGKTNFVDALRFVFDAISTNAQTAVTLHGSPGSIRRLGSDSVSFALRFDLGRGNSAIYSFELSVPDKTFAVQAETINFRDSEGDHPLTFASPETPQRNLSLAVGATSRAAYQTVYDFVRSMRFYDFSLPSIRTLQDPSQGELLRADGSNLASVLDRMRTVDVYRYERLTDYMRAILPGLNTVAAEQLGPKEALRFRMDGGSFYAQHMSTGTLLALAVLVALFQPADAAGQRPTLLAIEEPERALHPAAVGVLLDAMLEASQDRQILITTQSPELLDRKDVPAEDILAVLSSQDGTQIGPVSESAKKALSSHLFTAGELVRLDQLRPEHAES